MNQENTIKLFQDKKIRVSWNEEEEKWYFSIVDIVASLTDSEYQQARNYWKVLKSRLKNEGNQSVTNCNQLKMQSSDGKYYKTDVGDTEQILRLIQSIPSKKAEPFKRWLAKIGSERIDEIADPELTIDRALDTYKRKGYSDAWINQRLKSIEIRKDLTDEWDRSNVKKGLEYAILTDDITKAWSGNTTKEYKQLKNLKKENLRDNMSNMELILTMLAEATTTEISKKVNPKNLKENRSVAKRGGTVAGNTRKNIEIETGEKVVTSRNAKEIIEKAKTKNMQSGEDVT